MYPGSVQLEQPPSQNWTPDLRLLVEVPSWRTTFLGSLRDLIRPQKLPYLEITSAPAPFWPDVFVRQGVPVRRFFESAVYHVLAFGLLIGFSRFLAMHPEPVARPVFDHSQVIYYQPSEYLPPLDTRRADSAPAEKADPEYSPQPIISVPPEADNHSQTIVSAPNVRLKQDVRLPNIVAWTNKPDLPIAPAPLVPASSITRESPREETAVVAPPPDPNQLERRRDAVALQANIVAPPPELQDAGKRLQAPQAAVIAPPPEVLGADRRAIGQLNIAQTQVIAPAPQLPLGAQRTVSGVSVGPARLAPQVVAPPPSIGGSSSSGSGGGRVIALNLHPAVGAPPVDPGGNRRGSFAASPEGHAGASGNPGSAAGVSSGAGAGNGKGSGTGGGSGKAGNGELPAGLYVGKAGSGAGTGPVAGDPSTKMPSATPAVNPKLLANVAPPRVSSVPAKSLQPDSETKLSEAERSVFGARKFYSLTLNMPNLNSAGGSWVIRFAELRQNASPGDLSAPAATRKVDPAYPLELMRQNLAGTVIVYAVIHADGTVGNVRVLQSVDDRLDQFASQAVARWQFQPATKNGSAIDVEATFRIPFRPGRPNF